MLRNLQIPVTLMWRMSARSFLKIYYHAKLQDLKVKGWQCTIYLKFTCMPCCIQ